MTSSLLLSPLLTIEQCAERVTAADIAAAEAFASILRRREYLTWRAMLYEHLGRKVEIEYVLTTSASSGTITGTPSSPLRYPKHEKLVQ